MKRRDPLDVSHRFAHRRNPRRHHAKNAGYDTLRLHLFRTDYSAFFSHGNEHRRRFAPSKTPDRTKGRKT